MEQSETKRVAKTWLLVAAAVVVLLFLAIRLTGGDSEDASPASVESGSADEFTAALFADPDVVDQVVIESIAADKAVSVSTSNDGGAVVLSTGESFLSGDEDSTQNSEGPDRGNAHDVTTVAVSVDVPSDVSCLVVSDIVFGTDEKGGTQDGFIIELEESTWDLAKPSGSSTRVYLDTTSGLDNVELSGEGTTVERSTPSLEARIDIEPGPNTVFFSVYDADNPLGTSMVSLGTVSFEDSSECGDQVRLSNRSKLVALGDSYASGFGLPPFESGTGEAEGNNCQRSTKSYPELLAELGEYELESRACQGARTKDLYEDFAERGEGPQLDVLEPSTAVVVVTIGGNDTDWIDVLSSCVLESFLGPACNKNPTANTQFEEALSRLSGETDEASNIRSYDDILGEIRERAPFADIVIVSYPPLFAEGGVGSSAGDRCAGILKSDQQWINQQLREATLLITDAAESVDGQVVDLTEEFAGHGLCERDTWFMDLSGQGPLHPNADGHAAIAEAVQQSLEASDP